MHLEWAVEASNRTHCSALPACLWHPQCPHSVVFLLTDWICALLWCCNRAHPELGTWQIPSSSAFHCFVSQVPLLEHQHLHFIFDVWLPIFACTQFTKKSACSVPVSCPLWEIPLPQSLLPALVPVAFFGFGNHCKYYTAHGQTIVPKGPKQKVSISHSHFTFEASQLIIKYIYTLILIHSGFFKENILQQ